MRCPNCGMQNSPGRKYCAYCGMNLESDYSQVRPEPKRSLRKILIVVIIVIVAAVVAVPALLYMMVGSFGGAGYSYTDSLKLSCDYGSTTGYPTITIRGDVSNLGEEGFVATLEYTISDSRGWSKSSTFEIGYVGPGSSVKVNRTIEWVSMYNGQGLQIDLYTYIVPTWTHELIVRTG